MRKKLIAVGCFLLLFFVCSLGLSCGYNQLPQEQAVKIQQLEAENQNLENELREVELARFQTEVKLKALYDEANSLTENLEDLPPNEKQIILERLLEIQTEIETLAPYFTGLSEQIDVLIAKHNQNNENIDDLTDEGVLAYTQVGSAIAQTFGIPAPITKTIESFSPLLALLFPRPRKLLVKAAKELPFVKEKPEDAADFMWQIGNALQSIIAITGVMHSTKTSKEVAEAEINGVPVVVSKTDLVVSETNTEILDAKKV